MQYIGNLIRDTYTNFENWRNYSNSRKQAHHLMKKVIEKRGHSVVDKKVLKKIKSYSNETFGSPDYWPWLALYTEIRGEFLEGWIPDDYYSFELIPKLNPQPISMLSTIKSFDHRIFSNFTIEPLGLKISNSFFTPTLEKISFTDFKKILSDHNDEVVIKLDGGPSGGGIEFKNSNDVKESDFKDAEDYVVQPCIKQHESIGKLFQKSVNTIRIGTFLSEKGEVKVILKVMRFGRGESRIDNLVGGGGFISLNNEGRGSNFGYDHNGEIIGQHHPDSEFKFDDLQVPYFKKILKACRKSHLLFPYTKYIAWDVCVTEDGEIKFLEWNTRKPAFWCFEATIGPIWN